jgi:ABC-type branched-subunit amino acid transport system permease subunit
MDYPIPINDDLSISTTAFIFLVVFCALFMFKLRWAYSPSVGEELKAIRDDVKDIKNLLYERDRNS